MTPPSTFQIAPVTQLVAGEQEGDGVGQVAGGADPAQRVEAVEAVQRLVELVRGNEPLVQRGGHDGGAVSRPIPLLPPTTMFRAEA